MEPEIRKLVEWGRHRKNEALRDKGPEAEVPPHVEMHRDNELIAAMLVVGDQAEAYDTIIMAIIGYGADRVRLLQDAYSYAEYEARHASLEELFHSPDPADRAMVSETLIIAELHREGNETFVNAPYDYDPKKNKFRWKPTNDMGRIDGNLPASIRNAFQQSYTSARFVADHINLPSDLEPQIASDILVTRMIAKRGTVVVYAAKDERTSALLREALDKSGLDYNKL